VSHAAHPASRMSIAVADIPQAAARLLSDGWEAITQIAAALDMQRVTL
jgi:hypothetical protein